MDKTTLTKLKRLLSLLILSLVFSFHSSASRPYQPKIVNPLTEPWRWKHFPELEGKGIRHVVESADQKVWVASNEGVLEYDGYDWKTHDAENGLTASPVEQLLVATDDVIYATAANGIFRYDGTSWSHFFKIPEGRTFIFHNIEQLKNGSIIACADWGFVHFSKNEDIHFYTSAPKTEQLRNDLPDVKWVELPAAFLTENNDLHYASDVLEANDGTVWFALTTQLEEGKILRFRWADLKNQKLTEFEVITSHDGLELGEDQKLLQAKDGRIWVINSSSNKGLNIFDGKKWESIFMNQLFGGDEYLADIVQSETVPSGSVRWPKSLPSKMGNGIATVPHSTRYLPTGSFCKTAVATSFGYLVISRKCSSSIFPPTSG